MKPETREKYGSLSDSKIKQQWINNGIYACRLGTSMHETIEQMLRSGEIPEIPPPIKPPSDINFENSP